MTINDSQKKVTISFPFTSTALAFLAAFLSYMVNHSVWWAILHFLVAPIYLPYWLCFHSTLFSSIVG